MIRYLEIALGSSFELETQLIIAIQQEFGNKGLTEILVRDVQLEQKMLSIFRRKLSSS